VAKDFALSLVQEYLLMISTGDLRRAFLAQALLLTAVVSSLALMTYVVGQQVLRHDANDPQVQVATDAAAEIANGASPQSVLPPHAVDIAHSLAPFVIVYDESGNPIASSGTLHGTTPRPPLGVFDVARQRQSNLVTWQPETGVRIASVTSHFAGAHSGFVLAGRSLRIVEERESRLFALVLCGWAALMMTLLIGTWLLLRFAREDRQTRGELTASP